MKNEVKQFRGEYSFLSNMHPAPFTWEGRSYLCSEAAFQSAKCVYDSDRDQFCQMDGKTAKRVGKKVLLRKDWMQVKVGLMKDIVTAKFQQNPELLRQLLDTGSMELQEGNTWRDTFWGVDLRSGKGENHLGRILMEVRAELGGEAYPDKAQLDEARSHYKAKLQELAQRLQAEIDALPAVDFTGRQVDTRAFGKVTILRHEGNYLTFEVDGKEKSFALPGCIFNGYLTPEDEELRKHYEFLDGRLARLDGVQQQLKALE